MRLDKVDMERIYGAEPAFIKFIDIDPTEEELNALSALPMFVKRVFCSSKRPEVMEAVRLQLPQVERDTGDAILGSRNEHIVELDITTKCNLACPNCVRFSQEVDTWVDMSLDDVKQFIEENKHYGRNLTVKIIGGEPLVHPYLLDIMGLLNEHFHLIIATNGIMNWIPPFAITIENSSKAKGFTPEFHATCDAPIDHDKYDGEDYSFGCDTAYTCMNVKTVDGYYPCTVAGSIDRMLRLEGGPREGMKSLGVDSLEKCESAKNKAKVFSSLCGMCGFYMKMGYHEAKNPDMKRVTEQVWSKSWKFMEDRNGRN